MAKKSAASQFWHMKTYSYPFLFTVTIAFLALVFVFVLWDKDINSKTFLSDTTVRYLIYTTMTISFPASLLLICKGAVKNGKLFGYLKIYAGISLMIVIFILPGIITLTYFLPGKYSSYETQYEYASRSRKSCSGAHVDDPDLGRNIRICRPEGDYEYNDEIYVEKRSNILGAVVTHAVTFSHNSRE